MTRDEAEARAVELRAEQPQDGWVVRAQGDAFEVVRLKGLGKGPTVETVESKPKPPSADDPRTSFERNVGGNYGAF